MRAIRTSRLPVLVGFIGSVSSAVLLMTATLSAGQTPAPGAQPVVTFTKDVAPILQNHCQACHRPDTFAPMSLLTYEEVRPWAKSIRQKVAAREMPPWFIDKGVGVQRFKDDVSLSDQEIATILKWVDSGAPMGNPADMPLPRKFENAGTWQIGQPDFLVKLPNDLVVPARAPDRWADVLVDPGLKEDRYIQRVQIIPNKGYQVIHHIRTSLVEARDATRNSGSTDAPDELQLGEQGVFLNEYAIGKKGDVFPDGTARLIKAGTKINFQFHLHANGKETPTNVTLGLKFYPKGYQPTHVIVSQVMRGSGDLDIPPNTDNVRADSYLILAKPTRLLSYQPHMHNRGKANCLEAIYPDARVETLNCARFRFNWHINYVYDDDAAPLLPSGTVLHSISWHDNTAANKFNPDPDALITWGRRTVTEMAEPWLGYYYMSEEQFKKEVEARRAKHETITR
jgi:hypothetical protein